MINDSSLYTYFINNAYSYLFIRLRPVENKCLIVTLRLTILLLLSGFHLFLFLIFLWILWLSLPCCDTALRNDGAKAHTFLFVVLILLILLLLLLLFQHPTAHQLTQFAFSAACWPIFLGGRGAFYWLAIEPRISIRTHYIVFLHLNFSLDIVLVNILSPTLLLKVSLYDLFILL